jgi:hypothetical protein
MSHVRTKINLLRSQNRMRGEETKWQTRIRIGSYVACLCAAYGVIFHVDWNDPNVFTSLRSWHDHRVAQFLPNYDSPYLLKNVEEDQGNDEQSIE